MASPARPTLRIPSVDARMAAETLHDLFRRGRFPVAEIVEGEGDHPQFGGQPLGPALGMGVETPTLVAHQHPGPRLITVGSHQIAHVVPPIDLVGNVLDPHRTPPVLAWLGR